MRGYGLRLPDDGPELPVARLRQKPSLSGVAFVLAIGAVWTVPFLALIATILW